MRLLEFASYNNLEVLNTSGPHKPSRRWTWHSQEENTTIRSTTSLSADASGQSRVFVAKTRSFPGADIGSDHELVMMPFKLRLQRMKRKGNVRIKFSLEKFKDPDIAEKFRATIGGKLAPLLVLDNQDTEIDALINSFNTAVTETAYNILGKHRPTKKPWVTDDMLKL